jgi:peptidoglycan/LPS O-acetylase OafA/YrhL
LGGAGDACRPIYENPLHVEGGFVVRASSFKSSRITTILQLRHGVIGNGVSLLFGWSFFQASYHLLDPILRSRRSKLLSDFLERKDTLARNGIGHLEITLRLDFLLLRGTSLGGASMRQHANGFDLIRLIAAVLVLWSHQHALMGLPQPTVAVLQGSIGGLGLYVFFAVSGYLNTISASRHRSMPVFLFNRVLRIYPALAVCTAFTVVLGAIVASDLRTFLSPNILSYLAKNTTLLFDVRTSVPGVFEQSPFPGALTGSLWSLPYEVKIYIVLAVCLAAARYNLVVPVVVFASATLIAVLSAIGILPAIPVGNWWIIFSTLFLAGSMVAATQSIVRLPLSIGALIAVALAFGGLGQQLLMWQLLLAAIVIAVGCVHLPKRLRLPLDLSYGVFLYAFPIHQVSTMLFTSFWLALAFSVVVTFTLALLSAVFIERPALNLKGINPARLISPASDLRSKPLHDTLD